MKLLLDTHTLLWALTEKSKLSSRVRPLLPSAESWFSAAGVWEIVTKFQIGKLSFTTRNFPPSELRIEA
jgi:PIN domain nuclease of toxin-antitoxin system